MDLLAWPAGQTKGMSMACAIVVFSGWVGAELQAATGGFPIWPATGVAAGIALARPRRAAGVALGLLATRFATGIPIGVAIAWGVLTAIMVLAFVVAISQVERQHGRSGPWFPGLALLTAGCTAVLASSIGETVRFVVETQSSAFTLHWLAGDLFSMLLITPTVRALLDRRQPRSRASSPQLSQDRTPSHERLVHPNPHPPSIGTEQQAPQPAQQRAPHATTPESPPVARRRAPLAAQEQFQQAFQQADPQAAPLRAPQANQPSAHPSQARPSSAAPADLAHPILAGAAYLVWDRAQNQVSAQEHTLRQILEAPDDDDTVTEPNQGESHLDAATHHCHDWFLAAGPETRRAIRKALISLRRDRNPIDLRLPLRPKSLGRTSGRTLRLRLWGTYRSDGRLTHVHGVLEDLHTEWIRAKRIAELEQDLRQTHLALQKREQQTGKVSELLAILQHTHSETDHLLNDLDQAPESTLSDELADRTVDVAAAVRKALRITRRLATTGGDAQAHSNPSVGGSIAGDVRNDPASVPSRSKISVAALLAECDEEDS